MKKAMPYIIINVVAIAGFYALLYLPWTNESKLASEQIIAANQELSDFQTTIELFPEIMASHDELTDLQARLRSRLYAKNDIINLFNHLRDDAGSLGLTVNEISPPVEELLRLNSIAPTEGQPEFLSVRVSLEGDFVSLGRFIKQVEEATYFRGIGSCEFISSGDPARGTMMNLRFRALLGYLENQS